VICLPLIALAAAVVVAGPEVGLNTIKTPPDTVTIQHCMVSAYSGGDVPVPAKEAGVLTEILVKEGQQVARGQLLAQIDDARQQIEYKAARFKLDVAKEQASNDISVRYARKESEVNLYVYKKNAEANEKVPGSVAATDLRQKYLEWERATLGIEQSDLKLRTDKLEAKVKEAEMDAAAEGVERRKIKAPLDGLIVEIKRHEGEWVQLGMGDTVLRILRMDRLKIEGFLSAAEYSPAEVANRPVTVTVELAHGRVETFPGAIKYVSSEVEGGSERTFKVYAEVFNRQENDFWLLRPGLSADMTIHLR
jgi:macrolide-specific efflux system membrane fusion protein